MDRITVRQARGSLYAMQLLGLIASAMAMVFGLGLWAPVGTTALFALCVVLYRIGLYYGTRAWSVTVASSAAGKMADGGWSPASVRRGCLYYIVPCYALTALYICVYLLSAPAPAPAPQSALIPSEGVAAAAEEAAPEDPDAPEAAAEEAARPAAMAGPSSPLAQTARLACWIGALPFLPPAAFFTNDLSALSLPILAVLAAYPLLFPACYSLGYAGGQRAYERSEDVMRKGRRRAKARSRVMKDGKPRI